MSVLFCPRCVRQVSPDATRCPSCGYDIPAVAPAPHPAPEHLAEIGPQAAPARPGEVTAVGSSEQTVPIATVAGDVSSLIPGSGESSQTTGASRQQRGYRWGVAGAVAVGLALLAVIAVLAAGRIGQPGAASARPGTSAVFPPTGGIRTSGAVSGSASGPGSGPAVHHRRGLAQASVIAGYLNRSGQARHRIGAAIRAISGCTDVRSAVTTLRHAAEVRTRILTSLATADTSALRHGGAAVAELGRAMRASARADRHYAAWGEASAGCHGHPGRHGEFAAAQQSDVAATAAKRRFASEWNPIAATYGLAKQNANTI